MQNELDIVRDVSTKLDAAGIGYMLTGSMAMNYYAEPRMTRNIDVVVALPPRGIRPPPAHPHRRFRDMDREQGRPHSFKVVWARDSESERQRHDVRNLAATGCDEAYIARWTGELEVTSLWQSCRA